MATATVEITLPGLTGFTLSLQLYTYQTDTLVHTIALTEETNRKGTYRGTQEDPMPGIYHARCVEGTTTRGEGYVALTNAAIVHTVLGMPDPATLTKQEEILTELAEHNTGAGTGARTVAVTVNDGSTLLQNAKVRMTEGVNTYLVSTNASGVAVFNLDDATYTVGITKSGYTYSGTTLVVDGNESPTYSMTQNMPTPSANPARSNLTITCYDEYLDPEPGAIVTLQMVVVPTGDTGGSFDLKDIPLVADENGVIEIEVARLAQYRRTRGSGQTDTITIPDAATCTFDSFLGREE